MILGLIPARGGSKGIPGKNIRKVMGKPLIAHAIECGKSCSVLDHVIVSTDSEEIAAVAKEYGADVPFMRPSDLAGDTVGMLAVMQHAITAAEKHYGQTVDILVLLDPTGPLRTVEDIEQCIKQLNASGCDAVISGNAPHRNPYFNMVEVRQDYVQLVSRSNDAVHRRQDTPTVYDLNTVVWIYTRKAIIDEQARIPAKTQIYIVPEERAVDLDTEKDLEYLEFLLSRQEARI